MEIKQTTMRGGAAGRNARRAELARGRRGVAPDEGAIREVIGELAKEPTRLGIDVLLQAGGEALEVLIDPDAVQLGQVYQVILAEEPDASGEVAAVMARLGTRLAQHDQVEGLAAAAQQLDEDLGDTDRWAGRQEQQLLAELYRVIHGLLDGSMGDLSEEERDVLRAAARGALEIEEKEQGEALTERELTKAAKAETAAVTAASAGQLHVLRTVDELRRDGEVPDEDLDQALAALEALPAEPAAPAPRRGRKR